GVPPGHRRVDRCPRSPPVRGYRHFAGGNAGHHGGSRSPRARRQSRRPRRRRAHTETPGSNREDVSALPPPVLRPSTGSEERPEAPDEGRLPRPAVRGRGVGQRNRRRLETPGTAEGVDGHGLRLQAETRSGGGGRGTNALARAGPLRAAG